MAAVVCCGLVSTRVVGFVRVSKEAFMNVAAAKSAAATMMEVRFASKCIIVGFLRFCIYNNAVPIQEVRYFLVTSGTRYVVFSTLRPIVPSRE
jgi:phosphotransferase system  glucose/maltose/N-acetylglucosamine-specific IIC component